MVHCPTTFHSHSPAVATRILFAFASGSLTCWPFRSAVDLPLLSVSDPEGFSLASAFQFANLNPCRSFRFSNAELDFRLPKATRSYRRPMPPDRSSSTVRNNPRKSHRKSRLGCKNCKQRRIKVRGMMQDPSSKALRAALICFPGFPASIANAQLTCTVR